MENAFRLEPWQNLYIMLGSSAAALTGLLFVAVSLQIKSIVKDPVLRVRAAANTIMTVMLVINAAIILVPQNIAVIGFELCAAAFGYITWAGWRLVHIWRSGRKTPPRAVISISLNLLGIIGGLSLLEAACTLRQSSASLFSVGSFSTRGRCCSTPIWAQITPERNLRTDT